MFFVRQKQIIEDPNDDISSIIQLVEAKLEEAQEGEENIAAQNSYKQKWEEISHLYKWAIIVIWTTFLIKFKNLPYFNHHISTDLIIMM